MGRRLLAFGVLACVAIGSSAQIEHRIAEPGAMLLRSSLELTLGKSRYSARMREGLLKSSQHKAAPTDCTHIRRHDCPYFKIRRLRAVVAGPRKVGMTVTEKQASRRSRGLTCNSALQIRGAHYLEPFLRALPCWIPSNKPRPTPVRRPPTPSTIPFPQASKSPESSPALAAST